MYNFSVTINGITFDQDDFKGLAYLDGFPDSLQALGDEAIANSPSLPTTSTTSMNVDTVTTTTLTVTGPNKFQIGSFVWIYNTYSRAVAAVVTAKTTTTLSIQKIFVRGSGSASSWTIVQSRAKLTSAAYATLLHGGYGGRTHETSGLMDFRPSRGILLDSSQFGEYTPNIIYSSAWGGQLWPGGWLGKGDNTTNASTYWGPRWRPTFDGYMYTAEFVPFPIGLVHRASIAPTLALNLYGTVVLEANTFESNGLADGSFCGLIANNETGLLVYPDKVVVSCQGIYQEWVRPDSSRIIFIYSPHTKETEVWSGTTLLGVVNNVILTGRLGSTLKGSGDINQDTWFYFSYAQQIIR